MVETTQFRIETITDEFQLNGFEIGNQFGSTVQALSGGGFAVVYGNDFLSSDTLALSIFSPDGIPVQTSTGTYTLPYSGSALSVNMSGDPVIAENADGSILLRWNSDDGSFGYGTDLFTSSIDPSSGEITRAQELIANIEAGDMALVVGNSGYQYTIIQDATFEDISLSVRDSNGDHIAFYGVGSAFDRFQSVDVVTLSDGRVLVAATEDDPQSTNNPISVQFRQPTGPAEGSWEVLTEIDPIGPSDDDKDIRLAALPDGGFAVAYAGEVDGQSAVVLRIFGDTDTNPDGIGPIRIDTNLAAVESAIDITALNNGWVAVSWTETGPDGGTDIRARVFDENGNSKSDAFLVSSGTSDADDSSLASLANGSVVVSWTDTLADADGASIRGKILAAAMEIVGDEADNSLFGGTLSDTISGAGGNDSIVGFGGKDTLKGGEGNDTLDGGIFNDVLLGEEGDDVLYGWNGRDTLEGGLGDDTVLGESGDDHLFGGLGNDYLIGGTGDDFINPGDNSDFDLIQPGKGHDTIIFSDMETGQGVVGLWDLDASVTVSVDGDANTGFVDKGAKGTVTLVDVNVPLPTQYGGLVIDGTNYDDTYHVSAGTDGFLVIVTYAGNDMFNLAPSDGHVRIVFDDWQTLNGVTLDMTTGIVSNDGHGMTDTINGVENLSSVRTTMLADSVLGNAEDNEFILQAGNDTVDGGAGFDLLRYNWSGVDAITANLNDGVAQGLWQGEAFTHQITGIEYVVGSYFGSDRIIGKNGQANRLEGRGGDDTIVGGNAGDDTLEGGDGDDSVDGLSGNDLILGGHGRDQIKGGVGSDALSGGAGNDTLKGGGDSDFLDGGDWMDVLYAGSGDDRVFGGKGSDLIVGGSGHDLANGELGNDTIKGGEGNDTLLGDGGADSIEGSEGNDQIDAGRGGDSVSGGEGDDVLDGAQGDDWIEGGEGLDLLIGFTGDDYLRGDNGDDTLKAGGGSDTLEGNDGQDVLFAGSGDDSIYGGVGDDTVNGGAGDDVIRGGVGNDALTGGDGADVFVFGSGFGSDLINDFDLGSDQVNIAIANTSFPDLTIVDGTGGAEVSVFGEGFITLIGITAADLTEANFLF